MATIWRLLGNSCRWWWRMASLSLVEAIGVCDRRGRGDGTASQRRMTTTDVIARRGRAKRNNPPLCRCYVNPSLRSGLTAPAGGLAGKNKRVVGRLTPSYTLQSRFTPSHAPKCPADDDNRRASEGHFRVWRVSEGVNRVGGCKLPCRRKPQCVLHLGHCLSELCLHLTPSYTQIFDRSGIQK
jgi:hypothetical protein